MKRNLLYLSLYFLLHAGSINAQQFNIQPIYYTIFDKDSLTGFSESEARTIAINEGFLGTEFKVKMYRLKREYINARFGLKSAPYNNNITISKPAAIQGCLNNDFESSPAGVVTSSNQIVGWTIVQGYNGNVFTGYDSTLDAAFPNGLSGANFCNLLGCCPLTPTAAEVIDCSVPGGYIDNAIGAQYPIFSVFGTGTLSGSAASNTQIPQGLFGSKVIRLNNAFSADYNITKLSKTFLVSSANDYFQYALASLMTPGHGNCDATALQTMMYDNGISGTGSPTAIACPSISVMAGIQSVYPIQYYEAYSWTPFTNGSFGSIFNPWKLYSIDLSSYTGKYVTIEVIAADCNAGGHVGYTYFDATCRSLAISVSPSQDSTQVICAPQATIAAPEGFTSYQWWGPNGFNSTNATFTTAVSGTYTLQITEPSLCSPISQTITINVSNTAQISHSADSVICKGEGAVLTALGMYNCIWNTGDETPSIFIMPDSTSSYFVTGTTPQGCTVSASYIQHVDECTGLKSEKLSSGVNLFPNPNGGEFILTLPKEIDKAELVITNALGLEIHRQNLRDSKNTIRLKNPKPGVYFYAVSNNKEIRSKGKFEIE